LLDCPITVVKGAMVEAANARIRSTVKTLCILAFLLSVSSFSIIESILNLSFSEKAHRFPENYIVSGESSEFEKPYYV
jgi:hypothetical protein